MQMSTGTVAQRLRPLRYAFLVDPTDRTSVLQAIELASTQWGGMFNPIVPVYAKRLPKIWARHEPWRRAKPEDIARGYIEGFDPDFIVPMGSINGATFAGSTREVVTPGELKGQGTLNESTGYGIGLPSILANLVDQEFKYVRKDDVRILFQTHSRRHEIFLASAFGIISADLKRALIEYFAPVLPIEDQACSMANFVDHLHWRNLFPRRIGAQSIKYRPADSIVYCLDATNVLDVLDYWNLRAAGSEVLAAPLQAFSQSALRSNVKDFIEAHYGPHRHNANYYFRTTVQAGRSLKQGVAEAFIESLGIERGEKPTEPRYVVRWWYPRLWDKWAREQTNEHPTSSYSSDVESNIRSDGGNLVLRTLDPAYKANPLGTDTAMFANEIRYTVYGATEPVAAVLPLGSKTLAQRTLPGSFGECRLSSRGIVYLARHRNQRIYFDIPIAEEFMFRWLRDLGWTAELSSAGRVAKHMQKALGGLSGMNLLLHGEVLKILDGMASEKVHDDETGAGKPSKWIGEKDLRDRVTRILKEDDRPIAPDDYVRMLVERGVLRLGLMLHCPTCTRWLWRSASDLEDDIRCEHCLSTFALATTPAKERTWSYKPIGPFNVRGFAGGAYAVLLTLRFFGKDFDRAVTPLLSFIAKRDAIDLEADLALFCSDGRFGSSSQELIFCECKSYDRFKPKDVRRLAELADHFPGCLLVFAKLGSSFSPSEKRLLTRFVNKQRRNYLAQRMNSTVMVLTGKELFSMWGAPQCWRDSKDKKAPQGVWQHVHGLREIAEATQSIHLGLPTISEVMQERHSKRRKQSAVAPSTPQAGSLTDAATVQ